MNNTYLSTNTNNNKIAKIARPFSRLFYRNRRNISKVRNIFQCPGIEPNPKAFCDIQMPTQKPLRYSAIEMINFCLLLIL